MEYYHRGVCVCVCVFAWLPSPNHRNPNHNTIVMIANVAPGGDDNFIVDSVVSNEIASCGISFANLRTGRGNNTIII